MDIALQEIFPEFTVINGSDSDFNQIIKFAEKCQSHKDIIVYLQRNNICIQYFRLVEKVYNVKRIQIIIINNEDIYYYQNMNETIDYHFIANDVKEQIENKYVKVSFASCGNRTHAFCETVGLKSTPLDRSGKDA
jgi:hypothetical protein